MASPSALPCGCLASPAGHASACTRPHAKFMPAREVNAAAAGCRSARAGPKQRARSWTTTNALNLSPRQWPHGQKVISSCQCAQYGRGGCPLSQWCMAPAMETWGPAGRYDNDQHPSAVRTDAPESRTEPATPGRPALRTARHGHRRRAVSPGRRVVHSDAQVPARLGGSGRHRSGRDTPPGQSLGCAVSGG